MSGCFDTSGTFLAHTEIFRDKLLFRVRGQLWLITLALALYRWDGRQRMKLGKSCDLDSPDFYPSAFLLTSVSTRKIHTFYSQNESTMVAFVFFVEK